MHIPDHKIISCPGKGMLPLEDKLIKRNHLSDMILMGAGISPGVASANTNSIDLELASSQYLSAADSASLSISGDMTIEAWIKLESLPDGSGAGFSVVTKDLGTNRDFYYLIYDDTGGVNKNKQYMNFSAVAVPGDIDITDGWGGAALTTAVWIHIAVALTIATDTLAFYKDGVALTTTYNRRNATARNDSTAKLNVGALRDTIYFFDGLMDDVRVWNDVRTATEISDNYLSELVGNEAGLVGYWKLNNGLLDETSNANNLTNNGAAVFSTDVPF